MLNLAWTPSTTRSGRYPIILNRSMHSLKGRVRISDAEAVSMSRYLVKHDGLFLGSSSACNLVACVKLAKKMDWTEGQHVVTIL